MTALIDTIKAAFVQGRESWRMDDCVDGRPLLDALSVRGFDPDRVEAAFIRACIDSRRKWGNDWAWQAGDVAEAICSALVREGLIPDD